MEGICHLIQELGRSSTILCSWVCLFELVDTAVCGAKSGKMEMKSLKSGNFFLFLVELHFLCVYVAFLLQLLLKGHGVQPR